MSRAERARDGALWLYVGAQTVQLARRSGAHWMESSFREAPVQWADPGSLRACLLQLASEARSDGNAPRRLRLRVVVSDHWLAAAPVPWSNAQLRRHTAWTAARDHLGAWGHEPGDADEVRLDDAPAGQPRLSLSFPVALRDALDDFARELDASSLDVVALSVLVAARVKRAQSHAGAPMAVLEPVGALPCRSVTFVDRHPRTDRIEQVVTRNVGFDASARWRGVEQALKRLAWAVDTSSSAACIVLDATLAGTALRAEAGAMPPKWLLVDWLDDDARPAEPADWVRWLGGAPWPATALSMSRARTSTGAYRSASGAAAWRPWQAVAAGALLALTTYGVWLDMDYISRLQRVRAERVAQDDARSEKPVVAGETRDRIAAVNAVIYRLNLPLDAVLSALQPPKDLRVGLLSLEAAGTAQGSPTLKITAEAASFGEMTHYVGYLAEREPFIRAELVRHEAAAASNGLTLYRFSVEAAWRH